MVTDALFTNASKIHRILCNQLTYVQNKFDKLSILFQPADLRGINKKISKILIAISHKNSLARSASEDSSKEISL